MAVDFNIIGKRLKIARKQKAYTQEMLAEKMGVSVAYLSKIETGKLHINIERLTQICKLLDITEGEILNGVSHQSKQYLQTEFNDLLSQCSSQKQKLIYKLAKVICEEDSSI